MPMAPQKGNPVPLIIFVSLFVFSTVGLVLVGMELAKARKQMDEGFDPNTSDAAKYTDMPRLKKTIRDTVRENTELRITLDKFREVTGSENPKTLDDEWRPLWNNLKENEKRRNPSLLAYINVLYGQKLEAERQVKREQEKLETARKAARLELDKAELRGREKDKDLNDKQGQIDKLTDDLRKVREDKDKIDRTLRADKKRIQQEMVDKLGVKDGQIEKKDLEIAALKRQIDKQRRAKVRVKATEFDPSAEPADGEVVLVDRDTGIVISIGKKQGVSRKLRFQVYTEKADGTRVKRGEIEVKTVFDDISRAILVGGGNPVNVVHKNDIIINPAFDPGKARIFVADTVFDETKKQAFRKALAEYGSVLENDVSVRTDYLIIGARRGQARDKAEKLGVPMIREDELNVFLGRQ